ncbi:MULTISPECIES: DUF4179 domain-containing protein [unclassified Acinetobacter]|uniref:DUF4179 domain-containing protein n=1 Tax=unclassified Acinetobacter TaxID=196816 RepID=UPI002574FC22|nr:MULTISPECIES: DUF4179 domain-containing protein [unclassified Acinetobacter]MDM1758442.1 DUF4179 domain-containing protein [Acinetobacter sp. 256-1]MDM1761027.1 DUF4179 domain-containing protein [Acinetobacter sp. 251-1]
MKSRTVQLFVLGLTLGLGLEAAQAAAIANNQNTTAFQVITDKKSPIEKALSQQKREGKLLLNQDDIKVFTSLKTPASQNFLAEQHQRFSRFVQAIFQPYNS